MVPETDKHVHVLVSSICATYTPTISPISVSRSLKKIYSPFGKFAERAKLSKNAKSTHTQLPIGAIIKLHISAPPFKKQRDPLKAKTD